jgi:hypothetical protein
MIQEAHPMADQDGEVISNRTYDLLAIFLSKLEGLQAYDEYMGDLDGTTRKIVEKIRDDDARHAEMLRAEIERLVKEGGFK